MLRPGDRFPFADHVRAADPRRARWQDRLDRPWSILADGCHPNRDTRRAIESAGFDLDSVEQAELPLVPRLVKPYILDRAIAPE